MTDTTTSESPFAPGVPGGDEAVIRPRIRSGAIAWGLIVCGIAVAVLLVVSDGASRTAFASWLGALTPGGYLLIAVLALGGLILLWGLLGLIRRAQRR